MKPALAALALLATLVAATNNATSRNYSLTNRSHHSASLLAQYRDASGWHNGRALLPHPVADWEQWGSVMALFVLMCGLTLWALGVEGILDIRSPGEDE